MEQIRKQHVWQSAVETYTENAQARYLPNHVFNCGYIARTRLLICVLGLMVVFALPVGVFSDV